MYCSCQLLIQATLTQHQHCRTTRAGFTTPFIMLLNRFSTSSACYASKPDRYAACTIHVPRFIDAVLLSRHTHDTLVSLTYSCLDRQRLGPSNPLASPGACRRTCAGKGPCSGHCKSGPSSVKPLDRKSIAPPPEALGIYYSTATGKTQEVADKIKDVSAAVCCVVSGSFRNAPCTLGIGHADMPCSALHAGQLPSVCAARTQRTRGSTPSCFAQQKGTGGGTAQVCKAFNKIR